MHTGTTTLQGSAMRVQKMSKQQATKNNFAHQRHTTKKENGRCIQTITVCNKNDNGGGEYEYAAPAASATRSKKIPNTYATVLIMSLMCTAIISHEHNTGNTLSQLAYEQFASESTFSTIAPIIKIYDNTGNLNKLVGGVPDKQPTTGWITDYSIK